MRNIYLCLTAMFGFAGLIFGLTALIPQGMWIYLGAVVWGSATVTLSLAVLKGEA